jgi:hypothetical protein
MECLKQSYFLLSIYLIHFNFHCAPFHIDSPIGPTLQPMQHEAKDCIRNEKISCNIIQGETGVAREPKQMCPNL